MSSIAFEAAARLPTPEDNVAIAVRRLEAGTTLRDGERRILLPHTVMEGHRFASRPVARGETLLSWGLPFGQALRDIAPGEYVCNASILEVLAERGVDFALPAAPNFEDRMEACTLDAAGFVPGEQVPLVASPGTFEGYQRPGTRGVGTRNVVVVLATTSRSVAFAEALARRFEDVPGRFPQVDGVVAVTHTEGGGRHRPNNLDFVLRTLAGFMVHPNVGAVLAVDQGTGAYGNADLEGFMRGRGYPLDDVPHAFVTVRDGLATELERCAGRVAGWLADVNEARRTTSALAHLKVALQCGGSDAFSGVSGNALAGWVAKAVIANGGAANLAETDELIGAEPYMLENVRDVATAERFLEKIAIFKERARWHGASAEGNPSGGNKFRGLYNIALKSIGAARKRDPQVRLDHVIDYAAPMPGPGYHFMDSPGNDLESIAGQVASGCNLIFFITGNGSITNFPFVPTLKFVTTSARFRMLANEMDVNAGRYNDGESMAALGEETFQLARRIASGERSKGELAGHAQVQIWRDWRQTDAVQLERLLRAPAPGGEPLAVQPAPPAAIAFDALHTPNGRTVDQVCLVMPTSLCSGQVARLIADHLNAGLPANAPVSRYVALVHTEGCGSANSEALYLQTLAGHLAHRFTRHALLLEHGCEKTHNDAVRHYLERCGRGVEGLGFASVQLDGGIGRVRDKVTRWFAGALDDAGPSPTVPAGAADLRLALLASGPTDDALVRAFAALAAGVVAAGGTVVVPEGGVLGASRVFRESLLRRPDAWQATLAYGQPAPGPGLHVMLSPTETPAEVVTGLGGTGAEIMIAHAGDAPLESHPMIPMIQTGTTGATAHADDLDLLLDPGASTEAALQVLGTRVAEVASRRYRPKLYARGITSFQLTRGLLGLSM
jgi:altronate dehydratase